MNEKYLRAYSELLAQTDVDFAFWLMANFAEISPRAKDVLDASASLDHETLKHQFMTLVKVSNHYDLEAFNKVWFSRLNEVKPCLQS